LGSYGLFVNGVFVPGTGAATQDASGVVQPAVAHSVVSLSAGAQVSIRNRGSTTDTLAVIVDGQVVNSVMLTLVRIN
jgi:hypothetical protein